MRIDGPHGAPPHIRTSSPRGPRAGFEETAAVPAEAPGEETPATPTQARPHGLVQAAEHSHRSTVAALRQWINHPGLREQLGEPDLTAPAKAGGGFEKAVAAYRAIVSEAPATDPAAPLDPPVVIDPPVVTEPVMTEELLQDAPAPE